MFKKILIANRGEIACRVARTARDMGIATVAVYSDADADALHVRQCDEAVYIGPAKVSESYLCAQKIIDAALARGAEAIHPGYGFLSENADFPALCQKHGLVFVGPSASAIRSMGSKSAARQIVAAAGVPVLPGYDADNQQTDGLLDAAHRTGLPLLIKAVSGGGGKGMRVVEEMEDFIPALNAVKRESRAAFGDDRVLLERFLPTARHIEVQIFADSHGNVVHLFERDCSMQRRHQKVIEEAPAPGLTDALRTKMGQAAVDCASAISYTGAGTIEFLLAPDGTFYFMEMNTRLQVEHPVTEFITQQDLVEWQLRVAAGESLPLTQDQLHIHGHAFEARIYAENPELGFLPATGTVHFLGEPAPSDFVRIDTGIRQGDEVSVHYDPMIAKLIVWGEDRSSALTNLHHALSQYEILGVQNNAHFLKALSSHSEFSGRRGEEIRLDTRFIENNLDQLLNPLASSPPELAIALASYDLTTSKRHTAESQAKGDDPYSPWGECDHWQSQLIGESTLHYHVANSTALDTISVRGSWRGRHNQLSLSFSIHDAKDPKTNTSEQTSTTYCVEAEMVDEHHLVIQCEGKWIRATVARTPADLFVMIGNSSWQVKPFDLRFQDNDAEQQGGQLTAPMPGTVVDVMVADGDAIDAGNPLMIIEAMKMEHQINAPHAGTVETVLFGKGDQVSEGDTLLIIKTGDMNE